MVIITPRIFIRKIAWLGLAWLCSLCASDMLAFSRDFTQVMHDINLLSMLLLCF